MDQPPTLRKQAASAYLTTLETACRWLHVEQGRAARYVRLVREFHEEDKRTREHILAYNERAEISDLYELWEPHLGNFPALERKIRYVFRKGPDLTEGAMPAHVRAADGRAA